MVTFAPPPASWMTIRERAPLDSGYRWRLAASRVTHLSAEEPPEAGHLGAEPAPLSDADALDDLEEEIVVLSAHIHAATHRLLTLLAEFDRRRGWELGGHRSCAHWLAFRTGLDLGAAREKVRAARTLEGLPQTSAAMARGELSFSQLRALTRVATGENEADLLALARGCTTAQLERMVRAFRRGTPADEADAEKRRYRSRAFSVFPDDDGMYLVRGRLPAEVGALLMRAIEAAGDALYRQERWPAAVVKEARAQGIELEGEGEGEAARRRADAVGLLAERALAAGFGGRDGAEAGPAMPVPVSGSRAERYQVVLHVEAATLGGEEGRRAPTVHGPGNVSPEPSGPEADGAKRPSPGIRKTVEGSAGESGRCSSGPGAGEPSAAFARAAQSPPRSELEDGTRLSAEASRRMSCDAGLVRLTQAPDGRILDVGRRTRTIPPALRRALEARDRGCRFPGCGSRFTDAHHVVHWAQGGETSLGNCLLLCRHHHRLVHEEGWTVDWWGEGRPVFYDPRGGTHFDGRWRAPEVKGDLVEALLEENRSRGVEPDGWALGARWKREEDIPDEVYFAALEAVG